MANGERGEVALVAGERTLTLRMSINAVAEIETYLDKGINDLVEMVRNPADFRISTWRVLLWGALREHHPCTIEQAGEIMGEAGVNAVVAALGTAMAAAFPEAKGAAENPR
jgi:hypothetical protein